MAGFNPQTDKFTGIRVERDSNARKACLKKHGYDCAVCGFNFFETYGDLGLNFIHVHHREDLAEGERATDPAKDLVPVCPNCHAMLHKGGKPAMSVDSLKRQIQEIKKHNRPVA